MPSEHQQWMTSLIKKRDENTIGTLEITQFKVTNFGKQNRVKNTKIPLLTNLFNIGAKYEQ